jgi:hypothetical protein
MRQSIAANIAELPELLVSPRRAICSSARLPQLLRVRDTLYASRMSSQGVRWQLPPLAPHSTWQHLQIEDKERSPHFLGVPGRPVVLADPEYSYGSKDVEALRTVLSVPILKGNDLLGVVGIRVAIATVCGRAVYDLLRRFPAAAIAACFGAPSHCPPQGSGQDIVAGQISTLEVVRGVFR